MPLTQTLQQLRADEYTTIVALGDSNTALTFHTQGRMNWVGYLNEALFEAYGADVCTVINTAQCGWSVARGLERLERDCLRYAPDCVIISYGMNDAIGGLERLDAFRANLRAMIETIRARCGSEVLLRTPNPVVTVHGLPLPLEQPAPGKAWETPRRTLREYAAAIVEVGAALDCPVVDHYTQWITQHFAVKHPVADPTGLWPRMADAIHPGALGHLVFFREIAPHFDVSPVFPWEGLG